MPEYGNKYGRDYRPITPSDIDSATRMGSLALMSDRGLMRHYLRHKAIDLFASAVICEACLKEMGRRVAEEFGNDH